MTSVILTHKEFGKKMKNKYNAFTSHLAEKARIFFLASVSNSGIKMYYDRRE